MQPKQLTKTGYRVSFLPLQTINYHPVFATFSLPPFSNKVEVMLMGSPLSFSQDVPTPELWSAALKPSPFGPVLPNLLAVI